MLILFYFFQTPAFGQVKEIIAGCPYNGAGETPFFCQVGWLWGPSNFEECISENIKGVSSELAVKAIMMACLKLFPKDENSASITSSDKKFYNCLLKELKGVGNDLAAKLAIANCLRKCQKK